MSILISALVARPTERRSGGFNGHLSAFAFASVAQWIVQMGSNH